MASAGPVLVLASATEGYVESFMRHDPPPPVLPNQESAGVRCVTLLPGQPLSRSQPPAGTNVGRRAPAPRAWP